MFLKKIFKSRKGFVSIESIFPITLVLIFIVFFVSLLSYNLPKITMEKEVQLLSQLCKIHGGLTEEDVNTFLERMKEKGISADEINITAVTEQSNLNAMGVSPMDSNDGNYIKRESGEIIEIKVEIPANKSVFNFVLKFFGIKNTISDKYVFREVVVSERW